MLKYKNFMYGTVRELVTELVKRIDWNEMMFPEFDFSAFPFDDIDMKLLKEASEAKDYTHVGECWHGCRNVSHIFNGQDYDIVLLFGYWGGGGSEVVDINYDDKEDTERIVDMICCAIDNSAYGLTQGQYTVFELQTEIEDEMISVCVYKDTTGLFADYEMADNLIDIEFPEWVVRKWYEKYKVDNDEETAYELNKPIEECTFEDWIKEVYTADGTDGLCDFAIENGFTPKFGSDNPSGVFIRDEYNYKYTIFEGTEIECREFCRQRKWEIGGIELEIRK